MEQGDYLMSKTAKAQRWRRLLIPETSDALESAGGLESVAVANNPLDRIASAKEAMHRVIKDRFGGDEALSKAVDQLAITSEEAVAVLDAAAKEPSDDQMASLEAIVAFDGTRPSFLVKKQEIDFASSYNTGTWQTDLKLYRSQLEQQISCVGRVELGEQHIGTAFLVTPTLAITNRHVAQSIAGIGDGQMQIKANVFLDFGREEWDGRTSFDRRKVEGLLFAGKDKIVDPIDHQKFDIGIIRVSGSELSGDLGKRYLPLANISRAAFGASAIVTAIGYPGAAELYVPTKLQSQYEEVLARLLEGDGGAKRFAPGKPVDSDGAAGLANWTLMHDATTINGNSGSPVGMLQDGAALPFVTVGLHYGGAWGGDRVNWAHLLGAAGTAVGYGGNITFGQFCAAEGIAL
jgi:serine protease